MQWNFFLQPWSKWAARQLICKTPAYQQQESLLPNIFCIKFHILHKKLCLHLLHYTRFVLTIAKKEISSRNYPKRAQNFEAFIVISLNLFTYINYNVSAQSNTVSSHIYFLEVFKTFSNNCHFMWICLVVVPSLCYSYIQYLCKGKLFLRARKS